MIAPLCRVVVRNNYKCNTIFVLMFLCFNVYVNYFCKDLSGNKSVLEGFLELSLALCIMCNIVFSLFLQLNFLYILLLYVYVF